MQTISIAELRHDPSPALDAVADGESVVVTRYRRAVATLGPVRAVTQVSGAEVMAALHALDLGGTTAGWADELRELRGSVDAEVRDVFGGER